MKFLIRVAFTVFSLATIPPVANAATYAPHSPPTHDTSGWVNANA
jgi:hypothetical protein